MAKYVCSICGFEYDEQKGYSDSNIAPNTTWENVPNNWVCPMCGVGKDSFNKQ